MGPVGHFRRSVQAQRCFSDEAKKKGMQNTVQRKAIIDRVMYNDGIKNRAQGVMKKRESDGKGIMIPQD